MSEIRIQTLTPIHIGSGEFLRNNADFVTFEEKGRPYVGIVDPKKVLELIGEESMDEWLASIERAENIQEFVSLRNAHALPTDYILRKLDNKVASIKDGDTLKMCIHNGMGKPYIPGSSIKGAIRTAVLASLSKTETALKHIVIEKYKGKKDVSAKSVEAEIFGGDPNSDFFRFVKVGDAYFDCGCEFVDRLINLNIRENTKDLIDKGKAQLVEAINIGQSTNFMMKVDKTAYDNARNHWSGSKPLGTMPETMKDIASLFVLINAHSTKLVNDEINYWNGLKGKSGASEYVLNMEKILHEIRQCVSGKECVLRIGHASGWRFMTGAWPEDLKNFKSDIVPASRYNNKIYTQYDFPKSRRLDEKSGIWGFVKLSVE